MDAANDNISTNKPPLLPKPTLIPTSSAPSEHVIPQMVVTSAEDEAEEIQNVSQAVPVSDVSTSETSSPDIQVKETKDTNLPTKIIHDQRVEDGSQAADSKSLPEDQTEIRSDESVSHSVIQRPLIVESERCISQASTISEPSVQISETPTPPPSLPTTTTQRPLIFDSSSQQGDNFVLAPEGTFVECSPNISPVVRENLERDARVEDEKILDSDAAAKPKSSSFSWMPSFPKLHASEKEEKPSDAQSSKKESELIESSKPSVSEAHAKKDGLQGMKKFFDNLLHDTSTEVKDKPATLDDHHENADASVKKTQKEGKHGMMKIFSSSKQEPETKGKVSPTPLDHPKEMENVKETSKDSKFNVKKMLDSFIHDTSEKKDIPLNLSLAEGKVSPTANELSKEADFVSKDSSKDSKFPMKKMFDSFKHDTHEKKNIPSESSSNIKHKETVPSPTETEGKSKDASKDSKFTMKKIFDSFKPDSSEKKDISSDIKNKGEVISTHTEAECKSKDSKFKVKKMLDTFKLDSPEKKDVPTDTSLDVKNKDEVKPTSSELESKPKDVSKDSKFNMKKMFDSFKTEPHEKKDIPVDLPVDTESNAKTGLSSTKASKEIGSSKDSKYSVKKMLDSFKHDPTGKKEVTSDLSQPEPNLDTSKTHKDSKSGLKFFFDSFKHDESTSSELPTVKISEMPTIVVGDSQTQISKSILLDFDYSKHHPYKEPITTQATENLATIKKPEDQNKGQAEQSLQSESTKVKSKEGSVKKFFHSFKSDEPSTSKGSNGKFHVTFLEKDSLKRSHSFKDSILLKDEHFPEQTEKGTKDSSYNIKKYFMPGKQAEAHGSDKTTEKKKSKPIKRSESCKETAAEKEKFHGFRGFLDSLAHKTTSKSSQASTSPKKQVEEHIYDTVGKPEESIELKQVEGISKLTQVKPSDSKQKEDTSGMKKLFDSFRHKEPASKPKNTKNVPKEEKVYEKIDISPIAPTTSEPKKKDIVTKDLIKESQPTQNIEAHKQKEPPKIVLNLSPKLTKEKKTEPKITPSIQISEPSTSTDSKSMFSSISDNFTAFKDKMMHSKDIKKNEALNHNKAFEEYDLQSAAIEKQLSDSSAGTYKPIEDASFINIDLKREESDKDKSKSAVDSDKNISKTSPESSQKSVISDPKNLHKPVAKAYPRIEPGTPETLYDTCCMRLANLLGKKALEIVSEKSKAPPKKPPKPSAEAIAKARAAVVSRHLREMHNKGRSIGESIPVGYDGIRFADDETESSCDYKDVENFDYILDYELLNRYKCDSKLDKFNDPTCSSISSYYTADTVTLKDETFSDAPLETASLDGDNSNLFPHPSSSPNESDFHSLPSNVKDKTEREKLKALSKTVSSNTITPRKKVPPPLPPKPTILPKQKNVQNNSDVSQCINGLSLSPRLQTKFSKDSVATKQRPLMVAGLKGTEFTSLQTKHKDNQNKERTFNTILKNESLKNISTISPLHKPLQSTKSSPHLAETSTSKKQSPQRPPPPVKMLHPEEKKSKPSGVAPPVPEKPKRESRTTVSQVTSEKRTVSPPRPPPPVKTKVSIPPPRPPPPDLSFKSPDKHSYQNIENQIETSNLSKSDEPINSQKSLDKDTSIPKIDSRQQEKISAEVICTDISVDAKTEIISEDSQSLNKLDESSVPSDQKDKIASEPSIEKSLSEAFDITLVKSYENVIETVPKPPPRGRRIRSRTVEIPPKEKTPEAPLRRSQSLTDIDIEKRTSHLGVKASTEKQDLKHLYTSVNKDGKRAVLSGSQSPNLVSARPLPAPPPPPRKFRSLDRKPKEKHKSSNEVDLKNENESVSQSSSPDLVVKPPERKRKTDKQRFLSLSTERKHTSSEFQPQSLRMPRSYSVPLKPERKMKHAQPEYDENANFAFPTVAEVHHSAVLLDECGNEIQEASSNTNIPSVSTADSVDGRQPEKINPHPRRKKEKNPKKSHSSWYDKSDESWEIVDWDSVAATDKDFRTIPSVREKKQMRRRSDPIVGRKIHQASKFYIDVEIGNEGLPLVDKETSPLHLDCSEKSVQTSLETLSQGIVSHDEQSENAESSDNTDHLLDIVKTLQSELKTTLNRHKSLDDEENDTSNTATDSEKVEKPRKKILKTPSLQSSTSEVWPISSSEESDGELSNEGATNLSELALTRKKNKIFYIAQEILTSEEVFVDTLKLLNVDFKAAVESASKQRNSPVVPDDVLSQILNHLPQLQQLNENLLMELKDRIDNWDKTGKIADIIVKIGPFLKLYSWYIHDFESNVALLEESKKRYPAFAQVVKEFEASARCKRLALNHFMLKPIQRIPQYRLLLQEYSHHLSEDSPDYQDTVAALQIVSEVASHANDSMKQGDNAQKLISIQNSIIGHKEIIKPGRLFVKEGELMKLSRKGMQPRWFVLFNDLLLYLTPVQQGLYRINHELHLTGMKVAIPIQQDYQNEFSIISKTRSFTLAARSQEERQEWIVALTKAIEENASKRSTFTNIKLHRHTQDRNSEDDDGEFVLGKKAPVWIPDDRVTMCQLCTSEFTVTFRRHHCRACGKAICSICSSNRIPLAYVGGSKVYRVCDECYSKLGPDAASSQENAETDSDNQQIAVKPHLRTQHRYAKKGKRNLPSVLKEVCANDQGSTISGYLQKRIGKSWKKEWFVVKEKVLYEYKASEDVAALSSTPLLGYQIESFSEMYENVDPSLLFQLTHPGQAPMVFHTDSVNSTERWIAALKEASILE